jgi:hypothetical protein
MWDPDDDISERAQQLTKELPGDEKSILDKPLLQYGIGALGVIVLVVGMYLVFDKPEKQPNESKDDYENRSQQLQIIGGVLIFLGVLHIVGSIYLILSRRPS